MQVCGSCQTERTFGRRCQPCGTVGALCAALLSESVQNRWVVLAEGVVNMRHKESFQAWLRLMVNQGRMMREYHTRMMREDHIIQAWAKCVDDLVQMSAHNARIRLMASIGKMAAGFVTEDGRWALHNIQLQ